MRQQILDIIEEHLQTIPNVKHFTWLGRPLDDDEFPAIILKDTDSNNDDDSGHNIRFEVTVILKDKVSSDVAKETRAMMQIVSKKFEEAVEEMCLHGRVRKTKMDAESSEYAYLQGVMLFEIDYTADEWSV
jgi:hypothetical protein